MGLEPALEIRLRPSDLGLETGPYLSLLGLEAATSNPNKDCIHKFSSRPNPPNEKTKMNPPELLHTVGVDIAKDKFDCNLKDITLGRKTPLDQVPNDPSGFAQLEAWLLKHGVNPLTAMVCMESTGIYGLDLLEWLVARGWKVAMVNPYRIKAYSRSLGLRNKTDRVDADCIAEFCHAQHARLRLWTGCDPKIALLRHYLVRLQQLQGLIDREKNAQEAAREPKALKSCKRMCKAIQDEYNAMEKEMNEVIQSDPALKIQAKNLMTIPGIGAGSAPMMIQLAGSRPFEGARQVAAQVGLNVNHHQSGKTHVPPRLSKMGDSRYRKQLWWPAIHAMRSEDFAPWVTQLRARGLTNKQIICAVMRKLIHIAFGVIKSGHEYDRKLAFPNYFA